MAVGRRLAAAAGCPVVCSFHVPTDSPEDAAIAERRLAEEVRRMRGEVRAVGG